MTKKGGIIKQSESKQPKFASIQQILDEKATQKDRIKKANQQEWDSIVSGTDDLIMISKQNRKKAEQRVKELDLELTAAYGLGKSGYWSKQSKSYGQSKQVQNKKLDSVVHSYGQQTMPKTPSVKPKNAYSDNLKFDKQVHQTGGVISNKKTPEEIQEKLNAQKEAQHYLQNIPQGMTVKGTLDVNIGRLETDMKKVHDDFLSNAKKNTDSKTAKEDFAKYRTDYQALVVRKDAFNRAKVGVDTSEAQGRGSKAVSFLSNDEEPMYVSEDAKPEEKPTTDYTDYIVLADEKPENSGGGVPVPGTSYFGSGKNEPGSGFHAIEVLDDTRKNISTSQREDVDLIIDKIKNGEITLDHKTVTIESDWDVFNAQVESQIDTIFPTLAFGVSALPYALPILGATAGSIVPALVSTGFSIAEIAATLWGLPDIERGTYDEYTAYYVDGSTNVNIVFRKYRDEPYGVSAYDDFIVSRIPRTENWDDYGL